MSQSKLTYLGPLKRPKAQGETSAPWYRKVSWPFVGVVVVPTVLATIYYVGMASPRYVSEARFVVRAADTKQPSAMGLSLESVGISSGSTDSFAVHEYVRSKDSLRALSERLNVRDMYVSNKIDVFSRAVKPWSGSNTFEDFYDGYRKYVKVGYDSTTGISTLRVQAFTPEHAEQVAKALLGEGEVLVNRLNTRASNNAVAEAEKTIEDAMVRSSQAQEALNTFRNREGTIDPSQQALIVSELIGKLSLRLAELKAERAQVSSQAQQSPQLPQIDANITALEAQIRNELSRQTGDNNSLAPKIGAYERLMLDREMAEKNLALANAALESARQDQRKQMLYLERVVEPSKAERADEPRRLRSILTVLLSCLALYGTLWLITAGLRESKQGNA